MFSFIKKKEPEPRVECCKKAGGGGRTSSSSSSSRQPRRSKKSKKPVRSVSTEAEEQEAYDDFDRGDIPKMIQQKSSNCTVKTLKDSIFDDASSIGNEDVPDVHVGGKDSIVTPLDANNFNSESDGGGSGSGNSGSKCPSPQATVDSESERKCPVLHEDSMGDFTQALATSSPPPTTTTTTTTTRGNHFEGNVCPFPHANTMAKMTRGTSSGENSTTTPTKGRDLGQSLRSEVTNRSEEWDNFFDMETDIDIYSHAASVHSSDRSPHSKSFTRTSLSRSGSDRSHKSRSASFSSKDNNRGSRRKHSLDAARRQSLSVRHLEIQAKSLDSNSNHHSLGTNNSTGCPFFVGAADTNAHLFVSLADSELGDSMVGFYDTRIELVEDRTEDGDLTYREEVLIDFSYTRINPEFPVPISESDLFNNPTSDGFMTRKHGFLIPDYERTLKDLLEHRGRIWYSMGKRMEGLMASNRLLKALDDMEIVEGDEKACPDGSLQIAASLLAYLTYGYRAACWRNKLSYTPCPSLQIPFSKISERLGRKDVYFAPEDFMYNQRPIRGNIYEFDNLEIMSPLYGTAAEALMSKLFCESNRYLCQMQDSILALCRGEWKACHIHRLITEVKLLTRMFGKAIPDTSAGKSSIDPIEFATAFANATAPFKEGVPALSGSGCPVFVILDLIIGRKHWNSAMGKDTLMQVAWMPKNWRRYIEYIRQSRLFEKVPSELRYLWQLLKEVYCGERGWLGKHKYRAYQFVELAGALGRTSNKGSTSGSATIEMLEDSRRERDVNISDDRSSYKMCNFKGKIKSVTRVSEDRTTKLVTIESQYPLSMQEGDHVAVVMKNSDDHVWRFSSEKGLLLDQKLSIEKETLTKEWKDRLDFEKLEHTVYNVLMCAKLAVAVKKELTISNMCAILHPEEPRLYSFATVHPSSREEDGCVKSFDLLVTRTGPGGCSAFLFESVGQEVSFGLSTAVKCDLPSVKTQPLVVIAAGSGLGTYLPLLVNRDIENPKYAFLAFRSENTVPHLDSHLKHEVSYGKLRLFVELSREETTLVTEKRVLKRRWTRKRYIDKLLRDEADLIRELAAPLDEGGMEASFFICGNNDFFKTVRTALENIDHGLVSKLVRSNRLQLEVQARGGRDGECNSRPLKLTETCFHNKLSDYWTIIDGKVYDFTEYLPWHPGGRKILHYVAGTDCSEFWRLVSHSRDRMVYSQISAYEVGPFDDTDPDGLMGFLELVTRCENCVELYMAKEDLFSNLCDSYDKVINVVESIFGEIFVDIVCRLVKDSAARSRMLNRIYLARKSTPKLIAKRLFAVTPKIKGLRSRTHSSMSGEVQLRPVSNIERTELQNRLIGSGKHFFSVCKRCIVEYCTSSDNDKSCERQTLLIRMFFSLVQALESIFVSLSQPIPLPNVKLWDVMKAEVLSRKTFSMRFNPKGNRVPEEVKTLTGRPFPEHQREREAFLREVMKAFDVEPPAEYKDDTMLIGSNVIDDWYSQTEVRDLFKRLDANMDGLVSRDEILACIPQNDIEQQMMDSLREELEQQPNIETYNYEEFLLSSPWLAEKKRMIRVSSLLFRGMMMMSE